MGATCHGRAAAPGGLGEPTDPAAAAGGKDVEYRATYVFYAARPKS